MVLRPTIDDYKIIAHYLGKIIISIGIAMLIPLAVSVFYCEWPVAVNFLFSIAVTLLVGVLLVIIFHTKKDLAAMHAMSLASLSFLVAMLVSSLPFYLSGHYNSYLDACFEALSGFTTSGLTLTNDIDHMANGYNFWRHLTMFIGGQGIVVIALTFLVRGTAGAFRMYIGEARDERILPNVINTARFIWLVSFVYLVLGSAALSASAIMGGLKPAKAIFDSLCVFMAAWDTGGFTPQSQSVLFYHNPFFEIVTVSIMLLGSINFAVHYSVWTGNRKELFKNIEIIAFLTIVITTLSITAFGVAQKYVYRDLMPFFSKTFYHLISSQTTTGFSTIYPRQFVIEWGPLAMFGVMLAMAIGGCICSTSGSIKIFRVGIIYKALRQDIKKMLIPETAVLIQSIHHIKETVLEDKHVRMAAIILISYIALYLFGTIAGLAYGYSLSEASFESVSAAGNVGLSCGITSPSMPAALKIIYMSQMWLGRLEFMAIIVLFGMVIATFRGKK